jgi:hypothetical protein
MTNEYWKLPVNREELIDAVRWASGGRLTLEVHGAPLTVTVNLLKQRGSGALQVHLVNYDAKGKPNLDNIELSLRLSSNAIPHVTVFSPDSSEVRSIENVMHEGTLKFRLPSLEFYSVAQIQ